MHYGTLSGISLFALFVILYLVKMNPLGKPSWLGAWIPVVFMCLATRDARNHAGGGIITYWQAWKAGMMTAFFSSALFGLLVYIFGRLVAPGLLAIHKQELLGEMETIRMFFDKKAYNDGVDNIGKLTISSVAYNDFILKMTGGSLVSFVTAAVYRKKPDKIQE